MDRMTLENCTVVTVDESDRIFTDGRVVIENGLIIAVGDGKDIEAQGKTLDLRGRLLLPGLINAHAHSPATVLRGLGDDHYLRDWLENYIWPAEKHLTAEYAYCGARLSYLEFLYNGMTTNVDMWYFADSVAKAAMDIGLRAVVAAGVFGFPSPESEHPIQDAMAFVNKYKGRESETLIYPALGPHDASTCTPELLRELSDFAVKNGLLIHTHLSEAAGDNEEIRAKYGVSPTQYLAESGIMQARTLLAHCIHLSDDDISILKNANASVCYNPVSNMKLCDGVMPLRRLEAAGLTIAMGVDGAQSNNSLDLLSDAKTGSLLQKLTNNDPTYLPARDIVRMLTINGARAIGMEGLLGSIEPGKAADVITLAADIPSMNPRPTDATGIYSQIAYVATGSAVRDVFVNGKLLLRDGATVSTDKEEVLREANRASGALLHAIKKHD